MAGTDIQRKNMVESQVRPNDVTDRRILRAMLDIPRERFLPADKASMAYADTEIVLAPGNGRAQMAPRTLAKLLQLAAPEAGEKVLDVGSAGGYSAAVLAHLAGEVVALEPDTALAAMAKTALESTKVTNAKVVTGELTQGQPGGAFDLIVIEGAVGEIPEALIGQLRDGGRLVAFVDRGRLADAVLVRRHGKATSESVGFSSSAPRLPGFERAARFVL